MCLLPLAEFALKAMASYRTAGKESDLNLNRKRFLAKNVMIVALSLMCTIPVSAEEISETAVAPVTEVSVQAGTAVSEEGVLGTHHETEEILEQQETEAAASQVRSYTDKDLYVLAHVICGEAQGYPDEEQRYVGSVVLNRVNHPEFPNTIKDVAFQSGQYACTWDGNYYREPTAANWANAKWLLENGSVFPGHIIFQAKGRQGSGVYLKTPYHTYCY